MMLPSGLFANVLSFTPDIGNDTLSILTHLPGVFKNPLYRTQPRCKIITARVRDTAEPIR